MTTEQEKLTVEALRSRMQQTFEILTILAQTIREAGEIPSGLLYTLLMSHVSLDAYEWMLARLIGAGVVERTSQHVLRWIGEPKPVSGWAMGVEE